MRSIIYIIIIFVFVSGCLSVRRKEYFNRRYIQKDSWVIYEYIFKSNGKVKFKSNHFEIGRKKFCGNYERNLDTIKIEIPSSTTESLLVSDSCLMDFNGNCLYLRKW
jgi:hypothetical protein